MLLIPRASVLHLRCQPEAGLGGSSVIRDRCLLILDFHTMPLECCSCLLSIREKGVGNCCDREVCF